MPIEHSVDPDEQLIFSRAFGTLNDRDLLKQRRRLKAHPLFHSYFNQLLEFAEVRNVELSEDGVALLAERYPFGDRSRRAFLISPNAAARREIADLIKLLDEQHADERRAAFDDVEVALQWLQEPLEEP